MARKEIMDNPPFRCMVRANGQGEIWINTTNEYKMNQYGWRCGTNENAYELETLMGNWCEERKDIEQLKISANLPSQYGHYFNTVYDSNFNTIPRSTVPEVLRNLKGRHPHAHPHHQPELDSETLKAIYNSWRTTYRADYLHPQYRKRPIWISEEVGPSAARPLAPTNNL